MSWRIGRAWVLELCGEFGVSERNVSNDRERGIPASLVASCECEKEREVGLSVLSFFGAFLDRSPERLDSAPKENQAIPTFLCQVSQEDKEEVMGS